MLTRISSPDSPLASPTSPAFLKVADVAALLLKLRPATAPKQPLAASASGDAHTTHPDLAQLGPAAKKLPLVQEETFVCADAVDARKLVRASRAALLDKAETLGANCLVDERWTCAVYPTRYPGAAGHATYYKVHVTYEASAARTPRRDPRTPPALERARGVPGLMTILERQ